MNDFVIDYNIEQVINDISMSINKIDNDLNSLYSQTSLLENNWNTKEKEMYFDEYVYKLKNIKDNYPSYLNNYLSFLKNSINKYNEVNLSKNDNNLDIAKL